MACPDGTTIRYDIDLHTDPDEDGNVRVAALLTFCLIINGSDITGWVDTLGVSLTGTNQPLANGVDHVTLRFLWGSARIIMRGFTFPESADRRECLFRFNAVAPDAFRTLGRASQDPKVAAAAPAGPDVGDTGTGTGSQT